MRGIGLSREFCFVVVRLLQFVKCTQLILNRTYFIFQRALIEKNVRGCPYISLMYCVLLLYRIWLVNSVDSNRWSITRSSRAAGNPYNRSANKNPILFVRLLIVCKRGITSLITKPHSWRGLRAWRAKFKARLSTQPGVTVKKSGDDLFLWWLVNEQTD